MAQRFHGAQQRCLFIQRLTGVADKDRGDAEDAALGSFHDERRAGGIPHGVAARFKGSAHAAAGERGGVGFALHQLLAAEPFQDHALFIKFDKGVMLFRGQSGLRLKPVGEMRDPLAQRPFLHGMGHHIGDGHVQLFAFADGGAQFFVHVLGHLFAHHLFGKAVDAVNLGARHGLRRIVYFIVGGDGQQHLLAQIDAGCFDGHFFLLDKDDESKYRTGTKAGGCSTPRWRRRPVRRCECEYTLPNG
ncbi:MAG: hypothetical protein BWY83_00502 [bacterium ADurb.Bin478]|nr:MAG: hypothetical protein BWY83_00502 [bacterium ADurb.Bin478]